MKIKSVLIHVKKAKRGSKVGPTWLPLNAPLFFETARIYLTWPFLLLQIMYSTGKNNPHCRFSVNHSQKSVMRRRKSNYIYVPHNIDLKTIAITCLYAIPRVYLHASMELLGGLMWTITMIETSQLHVLGGRERRTPPPWRRPCATT